MHRDISDIILAPYEGNNVIGVIVTPTPRIVIHIIQELTDGKKGQQYVKDIVIFRNKANKRTIIYDTVTLDELWVIQEKPNVK